VKQGENIVAYLKRRYGRDTLTPEEVARELLMSERMVHREQFLGRLEGFDVASVAKYIVESSVMRRHL